jgi:hypothetical protein
MNITTKLAPGEKGFVLHDNKAFGCTAVHVSINARQKKGGYDALEIDISYTLTLALSKGSKITDDVIHNVPESRVFKTKEELLESL